MLANESCALSPGFVEYFLCFVFYDKMFLPHICNQPFLQEDLILFNGSSITQLGTKGQSLYLFQRNYIRSPHCQFLFKFRIVSFLFCFTFLSIFSYNKILVSNDIYITLKKYINYIQFQNWKTSIITNNKITQNN